MLILAVPIIISANPIDPAWQPGWYDDADTDRLVTQTMSPEGMIGLAGVVLACLLFGTRLVGRNGTRARRGWEPGSRSSTTSSAVN